MKPTTRNATIPPPWPPTVAEAAGWRPLDLFARELDAPAVWIATNATKMNQRLHGWVGPRAVDVLTRAMTTELERAA